MEPANKYAQYEVLEANIVRKLKELVEIHFGGREVKFRKNDPRAQEINHVVNELIRDFPSDDRGNRFIGCTVVIQPVLVVSTIDLKPILSERNSTHLFPQVTGKMIKVPTMSDERRGTLYSENILELRNIRLLPGQSIPKLLKDEIGDIPSEVVCDGVSINSSHGVQGIPGSIKMIADMKFGMDSKNDVQFEAAINEVDQEVIYFLPLPVTVSGKVRYDRSVQLSNGKEGMLEDLGCNVIGGGANIGTPYNIRVNVLPSFEAHSQR